MSPLYLQIDRDIAAINNKFCGPRIYFWYEYIDAYYGPNNDEVNDDRAIDLGFHFIFRKSNHEI